MSIANLDGAYAIIVSAGLGKRMPKEVRQKNFLLLNDRPVLAHTLLPFEASSHIKSIVIVTGAQDIEYCKKEVVDGFGLKKVAGVIKGGKERQDSVAAGLDFINEMGTGDGLDKLILVHDGARCLVTLEIIDRVVTGARANGAAVAMVPVIDTIKEVAEDGKNVGRTLNRERLFSVQTPQVFSQKILNKAFASAQKDGFVGTDSSSLVERLGEKVLIVEGSYENIKITTGEDLHLANRLLQRRDMEHREG
jgi:2-C-methyl-D-erythritol 4-phosphate cytidylyltransferase